MVAVVAKKQFGKKNKKKTFGKNVVKNTMSFEVQGGIGYMTT